MKKSLSLLLAIAMVFSMFATVASAATAEEQAAYSALEEAGIFVGREGGDAALDGELTRAEFASIIARLTGVNSDSPATFDDVPATHWATKVINAVVQAGYMQGTGDNKFEPSRNVTLQEVIAVAVRILGLEVDENATVEGAHPSVQKYIAAALAAGLIQAQADYTAPATRGQLAVVALTVYEQLQGIVKVTGAEAISAKKVVVTFSDGGQVEVELEEALKPGKNTITVSYNDREYSVEVNFEGLAVSKAEQTGAKKITVQFNRALNDDEKKDLTYEVKNGQIPFAVTAKYADDNKSVDLTATYLPAAEYDVTVKGFDPVKVKVEDERVAKLEIGANAIQKAQNQDLKVVALNQFGEEVKNILSNANITVYSSKNQDISNKLGNFGILDASGEDVDNSIVVTVTYAAAGLSVSKTFKVVAGSSVTKIELGQVAPLKDDDRVYAGKNGYVLPYTLTDQYGQTIKLPAINNKTAKEVTFGTNSDFRLVVSDENLVDATSFALDKDGVLTFNTKAGNGGNVIITLVNPVSGTSTSVTIKIEPQAALKTFQLSAPSTVVVKDEAVIFPYVAADTYGKPIEKKDVPAKADALGNKFSITVTHPTITVSKSWKANGDLALKFSGGTGSVTVFVWIDGAIASQVSVDVKDTAYPVSITGIKDLKTTLAQNGSQTVKFDNLTVVDNYGRTMNSLPVGWDIQFTEDDADDAFDYTAAVGQVTVKGKTEGKSGKVKVELKDTAAQNAKPTVSYEITFNTVKTEDVKSITIDSIGTLYAPNPADADYNKTIKLTGKLDNGTEVAIDPSDFYSTVTSSNKDVVEANGLVLTGKAKGTAVIAVWDKKGGKLAEQEVTVSEDKPVISSVKFKNAEVTVAVSGNKALAGELEVKDSYGVEKAAYKTGNWYTSDASIASVDAAGQVTGHKLGVVTITFVQEGGQSATITVNVE
jgi:hypothetical protein